MLQFLVFVTFFLAFCLTAIGVFAKVRVPAGSKKRLPDSINIWSCFAIASFCMALSVFLFLGEDGRVIVHSEISTKVIHSTVICLPLVVLSAVEVIIGLIQRAQKRHDSGREQKRAQKVAIGQDPYNV